MTGAIREVERSAVVFAAICQESNFVRSKGNRIEHDKLHEFSFCLLQPPLQRPLGQTQSICTRILVSSSRFFVRGYTDKTRLMKTRFDYRKFRTFMCADALNFFIIFANYKTCFKIKQYIFYSARKKNYNFLILILSISVFILLKFYIYTLSIFILCFISRVSPFDVACCFAFTRCVPRQSFVVSSEMF